MADRPIRDILQRRPLVSVHPSTTVREAAGLMAAERIGALLIVENGRLAGIFTERDALVRVVACGLDPGRVLVSQVMTADPVTIDARRPFKHAAQMMVDGGFRHVPVLEDGRLIGMISARDALEPGAEGPGA